MKRIEERDARARPLADGPVEAALEALSSENPSALGHIDPSLILVVAGAARRDARASIRPMTFGGSPPRLIHHGWEKPRITLGDRTILYELTLRPRFFLASTPLERLTVLAHELWHISRRFDGTLDPERRHGALPESALDREVGVLVSSWRTGARAVPKILCHVGELRIRAWNSRPPTQLVTTALGRRHYDERDLFSAIVEQR